MSTAVSIAVMSATRSNVATSSAQIEARKVECNDRMKDFNNSFASVEQKRYYASCVDLLYTDKSFDAIDVSAVILISAFLTFCLWKMIQYK